MSHQITSTGRQQGCPRHCKLSSAAGFTAVEMLMVLGILAIMFGSMYRGFEMINRTSTAETVTAGVQQNARIGIEFMVHDLRLAGLNPQSVENIGLITATATDLQFTADTNYDGDVNDPFENIRYNLNGDRVEQTNHLGTETLLRNVSNLTFTYLDEAGDPTTVMEDIRSVDISLTLERPAGRRDPVARTYTTRVRCRNL